MNDALAQDIPALMNELIPSVLETMLHLQGHQSSAPVSSANRLTAAVHITGGAFLMSVFVHASHRTAREVMRRYLNSDPTDRADDVARDTLGEIANVIAGNLKSIIAPQAKLSMPSITQRALNPEFDATRAVAWDDECLWVSWTVGPV